MNKLGEKHSVAVILMIAVVATLMGYGKAEAQWEKEWQKTLAAGKKEGKVVVYGSSFVPAVKMQAPIFKKQFGIDLDVMAVRGDNFVTRLRTEEAAGLNVADMVITGGNSMFTLKQMGLTAPIDNKLILPEVINPKLWYTLDSLPWFDDQQHLIHFLAYPNRDIAINTDLVKPGEIQSWQDLLKPQFKGKIVMNDPTIAGSGFNGFSTYMLNKATDEKYYRQLVATQDLVLSRNERQIAEWLARGKYSISISVPGTPIAEMLNAGAHIAHVSMKEGSYLSYDGGIIGILAKAPHPNAAKVFVNWLLSREGQIFAQKAMKYQSARNDIPTSGAVSQESMRVPGERYFVAANSMERWGMNEQEKSLQLAKDIFAPLLGR